MTLANQVTIGRILLIPIFVVAVLYYWRTANEDLRWLALGLFFTAAASDGIDGWIARRFNQRSQLGAILDPLADKLLVLSALILLSRSRGEQLVPLPLWLVATILSRDAILVLGFSLIQYTCGHVDVRPRVTGKVATVLQMAVILLTLANVALSYRDPLAIVALVFTVFSGLQHARDGLAQLGASPKSLPAPPDAPPSDPTR